MATSRIVTLDALYEILAFTDKYDMTSLLVPWIQGWVLSVSPLQEPRPDDDSWTAWKAVVVSREHGALGPLQKMVRNIIMNTEINSSGELL